MFDIMNRPVEHLLALVWRVTLQMVRLWLKGFVIVQALSNVAALHSLSELVARCNA